MKIDVLGTGCAKCVKLYKETEKALVRTGITATLQKVEKLDEIMKYGVMFTPALVIDGEVKASGRVVPAAEIADWLVAAAK